MSRIVELMPADEAPGLEFEKGGRTRKDRFKAYGERVAKYVPAEVIAFYSAAVQLVLLKSGPGNHEFRVWAFAIVGLLAWIGTPFYIGSFSNKPDERLPNQIMATIAFGVWAAAYPAGLLTEFNWHEPVVSALLLLSFTFVSGFVAPRRRKKQ